MTGISIQGFEKHQHFMRQALELAKGAKSRNEVPIGAIVVQNNQIIGRGYNQVQMLNDPTAHAEMIAITAACGTLEQKYLKNCTLYVTLEPCPMCAGALVWSKIDRLVFGASDSRAGACGSVFNLTQNKKLNHRLEVTQGILEEECSHILKHFFSETRAANNPIQN